MKRSSQYGDLNSPIPNISQSVVEGRAIRQFFSPFLTRRGITWFYTGKRKTGSCQNCNGAWKPPRGKFELKIASYFGQTFNQYCNIALHRCKLRQKVHPLWLKLLSHKTFLVFLSATFWVLSIMPNSGNFGRKLNGKVRFGSVRPEYSIPPLEVVHFDRSDQSDRNFAVPFIHFDKPVRWTAVDFTYVGDCRKEKKMVRAIPLSWPGLIGKCCSIFPWLVPLVSDRLVWYNGSTLCFSAFPSDNPISVCTDTFGPGPVFFEGSSVSKFCSRLELPITAEKQQSDAERQISKL